MATATQALKNFIDGESVEAAEGGTDAVLNPATGEEIAQAPSSTKADVDRAVKAARTAFETWGNTTPGERALALIRIADALEANAEEIAQLESANAGKPISAFRDDEIPFMVDNLRFFAGAGAQPRGQGRRRVRRGLHVVDPPRADRRRRPDRAVELPADDGRVEDRPGARGGQHDRPQARPDHAGEHDPPGRDRRRVPAQGRAERRRRRQRPRRGARRARRRRHGLADRLGRDRQVDRRARGQDAQEGPPRARRQGAGRGLRRRRPRLGAGDDRGHRLLQRRPGLHGGHARARLRATSSTTSSTASPRRPRAT